MLTYHARAALTKITGVTPPVFTTDLGYARPRPWLLKSSDEQVQVAGAMTLVSIGTVADLAEPVEEYTARNMLLLALVAYTGTDQSRIPEPRSIARPTS